MKKVFLLSVVLVVGSLFAQAPLPSGKAPFKTVRKQAVREAVCKFEKADLTYNCGSKKIVFHEDGTFNIISDGRLLGSFYFFIATDYAYWQTNEKAKKIINGYDGKKIQVSKIETNGDELTIEGVVPYQKPGEKIIAGTWRIEVKPEGNGRLAFHVEFMLPDGLKAKDSSMFIILKNIEAVDAGTVGRWTPGDTKRICSFKPTTITLEGMNPDDTFKVESDSWSTQGDSLRLNFKTGGSSFTIDLGRCYEPTTGHVTGGVDFLKSDALNVPARGKNLLPNPYFADRNQFFSPHVYSKAAECFSTDSKFGRYSLAKGGWHRFATVPADPGKYTFSFYAKGKGSLSYIVRSVGNGYEKTYEKNINSPEKWTRCEIPFDFPRASAIVSELRMPDGISIDGIQLEKGEKATEFEAPRVEACAVGDFFFEHGKNIELVFELSTLEKNTAGRAVAGIYNFFGEEVFRKEFGYDFGAGQYPKIRIAPGSLADGLYIVRFNYGKNAPEQFFRFSVMPFLENKHKTARVFSLSYLGHQGVAKEVSEKYLARLEAVGIGIDGHSSQMSADVLAKYGKYGIIPFDVGFVDRTDSEKMQKLFPELSKIPAGHIWFLVSNTELPSWSVKNYGILPDYRLVGGWNDAYRRKFMEEIVRQVRKYPKRFAYHFGSEWASEIKNDPHYPDLYMAYREAVKSVYPDALVYEAGACNMDIHGGVAEYDTFLTRIQDRTRTDFASAHTYVKDIRQLYPNFRAFAEMTKKHPGYENCRMVFPEGMHFYPYAVPAWNTEFICWMGEGWRGTVLSYDLGWTEKLSAAYYARFWLVFLTEFERVWCATSSAGNTNNFAMDSALTPRAFQKIPNTLGVLLGNPKRFIGDVTFAPDTKCFVWEDENGRPVAAVWNEDTAVDAGLKDAPLAKMNYAGAEYIDLMGARRKPRNDGEFPVSPFPLFIRGKANDSSAFVKAVSTAILNDADKLPCRVSFGVVSPDEIRLSFNNPLSRTLSGSISILGKKYVLAIPKLGGQSIHVKLVKGIQSDNLTNLEVPYECSIDGRIVKSEFSFTCLAVKKFEGDWSRIPVVKMTNRCGKARTFAEADFSAVYQLAWDARKLYLRVSVTDDVFAPGRGPGYRWNNDILQVYFDTRCSAINTGRKSYDDDDYEYGFMPTADGRQCEVWRAISPDIQLTLGVAAPKNGVVASEIPAKFTRTKAGYVYEVEFPADYLLPIRLVKGYNFALGLYAADKDNGKGVEKGLSTATEKGSGCYKSPHLWPVVVLTE